MIGINRNRGASCHWGQFGEGLRQMQIWKRLRQGRRDKRDRGVVGSV